VSSGTYPSYLEATTNFKMLMDIPIGATLVYKYFFPKVPVNPDYCGFRTSSFFLDLSSNLPDGILMFDEDKCTETYCPILIDNTERLKHSVINMDQSSTKSATFNIVITPNFKGGSASPHTTTISGMKCSVLTNYTIESSLLDMTEEERNISFRLGADAYFNFKRFDCTPADCCIVDYRILRDPEDPSSEVP
jgi:hypothetical protein